MSDAPASAPAATPPSEAEEPAAARRGPSRSALIVAAVALVLAVPVITSSIVAFGGGWMPTADVAVMSLRVEDVLSSDPPLVGMHTTATEYGSTESVFHPGPMTLWLLAPFVAIFGGVTGMLLGTVAINLAVLGGIGWVAHRRGGLPLLALTGVLTGLLLWALRGEILRDPWNPHIAILAFALLLLTAWAVSDGDVALAPLLVVVGSFLVQNHVTYALPVALLTAWGALGATFVVRSARATGSPADGVTPAPGRSTLVRAAQLSLGAAVLLWLAPLIDQVAGEGNLGNILGVVLDGEGGRLGLADGVDRLLASLGAAPLWLSHTTDIFRVAQTPSVLDRIVAVAILAAMVALLVLARRRGDRSTARLLGTAFVAVGAAAIVLASAPTEDALRMYWYRWLWPLGMFVWLSVLWGALQALTDGVRARAVDLLPVVSLGPLAVLLVLGFGQPSILDDVDGARFDELGALIDQTAAAAPDDGPYLISTEGTMFWHTSTLVAGLERAGLDIRVERDNIPYGDSRTVEPGTTDLRRLRVLGGPVAAVAEDEDARLAFVPITAVPRDEVVARIRAQVDGVPVTLSDPEPLELLISGMAPGAVAAEVGVGEWTPAFQAYFELVVAAAERDRPTDASAPIRLDLASLSDDDLLGVFGVGSLISAVDPSVLADDVRTVLADPLFQDGYTTDPTSGMATFLLPPG